MIKLKVSKRDIRNNFKNVLCCSYCELTDLLNYKNANYYNANQYGWRNDIYLIDNNTVIVTGYEPFGNIELQKNICKKYNNEAKKIRQNFGFDYDKQKIKLQKLIDKMISEVIK